MAAAPNCGGNHPCSWPARDYRVVCVYASDGDGNKTNFSTLGCAVKGLWPPRSGLDPGPLVRRSGTSTATPVAAAIAALVMSSMRQCEEEYVEAQSLAGKDRERARLTHRAKVDQLGKAIVMAKIFRLMLGVNGHRDFYQYITPWSLFKNNMTGLALAEMILWND
ncbi:GMP synthase (glutamine-hydrolyzing) [Oleoguttula sp. CCFEE 5521]